MFLTSQLGHMNNLHCCDISKLYSENVTWFAIINHLHNNCIWYFNGVITCYNADFKKHTIVKVYPAYFKLVGSSFSSVITR